SLAPGEALQEAVRDSARAAPQREKVDGQGQEPAHPRHRSELHRGFAEKRPEHEEQRADDARDEKEHALNFRSVDVAVTDERHSGFVSGLHRPGKRALDAAGHGHPTAEWKNEPPLILAGLFDLAAVKLDQLV